MLSVGKKDLLFRRIIYPSHSPTARNVNRSRFDSCPAQGEIFLTKNRLERCYVTIARFELLDVSLDRRLRGAVENPGQGEEEKEHAREEKQVRSDK